MRFGLILDPLFERHLNPDGHPESPERLESIRSLLTQQSFFDDLVPVSFGPAEEAWIRRVHTAEHLEILGRVPEGEFLQLDPDTYLSRQSLEIAFLAAGASVSLVRALLQPDLDAGFAFVRPPGHHAEKNRAMGFCLLNNVAVAAAYALEVGGLKRVAIVDFDVHHGNGTQDIFWGTQEVLYVSTHQHPLFPGTGGLAEVGEGEGEGFTVNVPLPASCGNGVYWDVYDRLVIPILKQYQPELILVSAGFDAHRADPLAGMNLDEDGFAGLVSRLKGAASELCSGRIAFFLEGGYNLQALSASVLSSIEELLLEEPTQEPVEQPSQLPFMGPVESSILYHSRFWEL